MGTVPRGGQTQSRKTKLAVHQNPIKGKTFQISRQHLFMISDSPGLANSSPGYGSLTPKIVRDDQHSCSVPNRPPSWKSPPARNVLTEPVPNLPNTVKIKYNIKVRVSVQVPAVHHTVQFFCVGCAAVKKLSRCTLI